MKRFLMLTVTLSIAGWWFFCTLPIDPATMVENSDVILIVDSIKADTNGVYRDTVGKTVSFTIRRTLSNLIDSVEVDFGGGIRKTFVTDSIPADTFSFSVQFTSVGRRPVGISVYYFNQTVGVIDTALIIDIVNRTPKFTAGKPDTLYTVDDGDTLLIPIAATDSDSEKIRFHLAYVRLPDSAKATVTGDTLITVAIPGNCAGRYSLTVVASDSIDSSTAQAVIVVNDKTPPGRPVFAGVTVVSTTTPTWSWKSGGGGSGNYRYVVDLNDFSEGKSTPTDTNVFTSPSSLIEGTHTLFVQERDSSGNWSPTASWAILIDRTVPPAPAVTGTTPTGDRTPTWTWVGSDAAAPRFRIKLDSSKFTPADTVEMSGASFTPNDDLTEGNHTLFVQERDDAGNWSPSGSYTILVDATGPKPPVVTAATPTANRRPAWTWVSGGGGKGEFRCALDSNSFGANALVTSAFTFNASVDLPEGIHALYVQELDSAGNWSSAGSFAVRIDVTPPQLPVFTSGTSSNKLQPEWKWVSGGGGSGTFRYKLDNAGLSDGATVNTATNFIPPTNLIEGPHTFFLQESDSTGNWSAVVANVMIIDTAPPLPPELAGAALTNSLRPTWSWTMGAGGIASYRFKLDSNDFTVGITAIETTTYTPSADLAEGIRWMYVQGCDAAGNWSKSDSFATTIDRTPPDTPVVFGSVLTNSLQPTWSWSSGASGSGVGEYRYKLDSDDFSNGATVTSSTNFTPSGNLSEAVHTLYVQERDAAGNWSVAGKFVTTIDATAAGAPHINAVSPTNNVLPAWSWTSGGGSGTFRYKLDSQDFTTGATETTALSFTPSTALAEGAHILFVQEKDNAGNWSSTGISVVQVDLTPPSAPSLSGNTPTNDMTPAWSWSSTNGAGAFRFKIDNSDFSAGAAESSGLSHSPAAALSTGSHTLYLQERDAAGNWSVAVSFAIVIDTTAPNTPAVSGTSPTNSSRPIWSWVSGGGGGDATFRTKLDAGEFSAGTAENSFVPGADLAEGSHTLYVQERDAAGNWSASGEKAIVIDVTPPAAPPVAGPALTNDQTPDWTWGTGGGGNGTYRYKLDDPDFSDGGSTTTLTQFTPPVNQTEGSHTLYVQERDEVSNWSSSGSFAVTIDVTKPLKPVCTAAVLSASRVLTWTWTSGGGGNGIFRYRIDANAWKDTTVLSITSGVLSQGQHNFLLLERDAAGNWSDTVSLPTFVMPAPGNLEVGNKETGVQLYWTDSAAVDDSVYVYRTEVCPEREVCLLFKPVRIARLPSASSSYLDATATSCTEYNYYVSSYKIGLGRTSSASVLIRAQPSHTICGGIILPINPILIQPVQVLPTLP